MRKKSPLYKDKVIELDLKNKLFSPREALELAQKLSYENFDASLEVHVRTGINAKKGDQIVRSSATLPHGTGKTKRVAVFADGEKALEAKEAGADIIGGVELIAEIKQTGKADFDIAIATPDMMKNLAGVAKVLGPRGLMPSPKNDTVTLNIKGAIDAVKGGKITYKNDDSGIVHQVIGRRSFPLDNLLANYAAFIESVRKAKPAPVKGIYIKAITIATTMGPGIRVTL